MIASLSPTLEAFHANAAAAIASAVGLDVRADPFALYGSVGRIDLIAADAGLPLAQILAGLAWYAAVRAGLRLKRALMWSTLAGFAAFPVQLSIVIGSALVVGGGTVELGRLSLRWAWLVVSALVLIWIVRSPQHSGRQA